MLQEQFKKTKVKETFQTWHYSKYPIASIYFSSKISEYLAVLSEKPYGIAKFFQVLFADNNQLYLESDLYSHGLAFKGTAFFETGKDLQQLIVSLNKSLRGFTLATDVINEYNSRFTTTQIK